MLDTFRRKLYRTFQKYRAMHILLNTPNPEELLGLDDSLENIQVMPGPKLRRKARAVQADYERMVKLYGARGSLDEFSKILADYAAASKPILYVTRYDLERVFTNYENRFPDFRRLPQHGRIGIEVGGRKSSNAEIKSFTLEGSLFEDMAALWNVAATATEAEEPETTVPDAKRAAALRRATAKAAFNLLEGYLNGLAVDIQLLLAVSAKEKTLLQEWDEARNRHVRLSLRDKILEYVKLAARAQHPPIQESNSKAMQVVLATETAVRHALIHPTPRLLTGEATYRENVYLNLTLQQVEAVCDAVVELIRQIGAAVGPSFGDVEFWLFGRNESNRYSDRTFL
jgi:hypothetical protein